jgi:hypothetical protein
VQGLFQIQAPLAQQIPNLHVLGLSFGTKYCLLSSRVAFSRVNNHPWKGLK